MARPRDRSGEAGSGSATPHRAADEGDAAKQTLAADLEGMISGMLRTTQFATAATPKTRGWAQQIGSAAALDASTDERAFTGNSLIADLMQAKGCADAAAAQPAQPRRRWIEGALVLGCMLSVLTAGYLVLVF